MHEEIKCELRKLISKAEKRSNNSIDESKIKITYDLLIKNFKQKNLIEDYISHSGTIYPKLIGYNYYNDEEFFFKYKRRGNDKWTGRVSKKMATQEYILKSLLHGNEFENKELEQMILN